MRLGVCCSLLMTVVTLSQPCGAAAQQLEAPESAAALPEAPRSPGGGEIRKEPRWEGHDQDQVPDNRLGLQFLKNLMNDQKTIWTSPSRLHWGDADWLLPMAEVTAGFIATDRAASKALSNNPTTLSHARSFSNAGVAGFAAAAGGLYLLGRITHDDRKRETGVLAAEAVIDSLAVNSVLKYSFARERPYQDDGKGSFFSGGSSFPSDHSVIAWSAASVIAHEYPGPLTALLAYGGAAAISASRVVGKEHFNSDVFVGASIGWLIGQQIYRKRHDPELGGGGWEDLSGGAEREQNRGRQHMGSPFVPLDSWVYSALDRLAALGYIRTSIAGVKPWTRLECARLIEEAFDSLSPGGVADKEATGLISRLQNDFAYEMNLLSGGRNLTANLESAYTRVVSISGPSLTDSYHFGQTVAYDFGRPFQGGTNLQEGGSAYVNAGAVTIYVRSEFQHSPSAPPLPVAARDFIGTVDVVPTPPDTPVAAINRVQLLDAYVGVNVGNFEIEIGRQSLSWAPGLGGSLLLSDNIVPIGMVRFVNPEPFRLPSILRFLGPARLDQFFGQLGGHNFIREPFVYGQKIDFKPIPSLELGFGRVSWIGGEATEACNGVPPIGVNCQPTPFTPRNFMYQFFGQIPNGETSVPGVSYSEMDWTYYIPHVHNYIVFYGDLYAADDFLPIINPAKNPFHPGIYITRFPGLPKLDLHVEATSTESPGFNPPGFAPGNHGNLNYWNSQYRDGYTQYGNIIGNTVGRMGEAYQAWLTYWISPRHNLQFSFKDSHVDSAFVPGGGAYQDYIVRSELDTPSGFYLKTELQYENISHFPILFNGPQRNIAAVVEAGFMPEFRKRKETNTQ